MAPWNVYDQANQYTLGQLFQGLPGALQNFQQGVRNYKNRVRGINVPIQQRPVVNPEFLRPDYSGAGERARRFQEYRTGRDIPGANTDYSARSGQSAPAAERAYQTEKSRVAQLAAQNPELQRYEAARTIAAAQGATPEQVQSAEDIGMQIWAQKYGKTLAPKVKPGQAGYDVIQGVLNTGAMGAPADLPFAPTSLLGTNAMQTIPSYEGQSDLQPVGTPLPRTQFGTPENQMQAQMFNRFMSQPAQPAVMAPPVNPAQATYEGATNVQPIGDLSLSPFAFNTPAEKRRGELFQQLLNSATVGR